MSEVCISTVVVFNSGTGGGNILSLKKSLLMAHSELEVGKSKVFTKQVLKNSRCRFYILLQ